MTISTPRPALYASLAIAAIAGFAAAPAHAALAQFKGPGGDWHSDENWDTGSTPTERDTVYFGYQMPAEPATITLSEDAEAKNLAGDTNGPTELTLDLAGHTLKLFNESDVKLPIILSDGTIEVTNHIVVHEDAALTLGKDVTLKSTGISNQVQVNKGATLDLQGAHLAPMSGPRDLAINNGATLALSDGATIQARSAELKDGSTLKVTLDGENFEFAPIEFKEDVYSLGKLELTLAEGFTPEPGRAYMLIQYAGELDDEFDNVAEGETIDADGTAFTVKYHDGGTVSLTAAGGGGEPE